MLRYDFDQSVGHWIIRSARAYERAINFQLAPCGITWRQAQVLGWLALEGDLSQTELAERMGIEGPTLAGILDRMERSGWIDRHDCASDRRKKIIRPQPGAEPVWAEIVRCARTVRAAATRGLSREELETLHELLGRVQTNIENLRGSATAQAATSPSARPALTRPASTRAASAPSGT